MAEAQRERNIHLHVMVSLKELDSLQRRCVNKLNQVVIHANTYGVYPAEIAAL